MSELVEQVVANTSKWKTAFNLYSLEVEELSSSETISTSNTENDDSSDVNATRENVAKDLSTYSTAASELSSMIEPIKQATSRSIGITSLGRSIGWFVEKQAEDKTWCLEVIPKEIVGLSRDIKVYRAARKTNLITYDWHGDRNTFCPPMWWDLAIGSGACGLGCRACFLMLTHRIKRDPLAHLLYDNLNDFERISAVWLLDPARRRQHTLGVGIDRSDSLLYEGITGHVRTIAPLFGKSTSNPKGNKLVLLTKSANTHYLAQIKPEYRANVVVSFSLNPQGVADLWEGIWPDGSGERIPPPMSARLEAVRLAQDLGFEVRVRLDPILTPNGWQDQYREFMTQVKAVGIEFSYWTLGTYREKNPQLDAWRERWGLPQMDWEPAEGEMVKEGTHRHLAEARRVDIYRTIQEIIRHEYGKAKISLCKETHAVRKAVAGMCNSDCNCLI